MAPHSSTLAWRIPWMEEPGGLQSMGWLRVRHDWATSLSLSLSCIGEGNGNPLQCSCLENPRDEGAWWAAIYGVAQSRTRLKQLSSSSSSRELTHMVVGRIQFLVSCWQRLPSDPCHAVLSLGELTTWWLDLSEWANQKEGSPSFLWLYLKGNI